MLTILEVNGGYLWIWLLFRTGVYVRSPVALVSFQAQSKFAISVFDTVTLAEDLVITGQGIGDALVAQ